MATVNKCSPRCQRFQRLFLILLAVSGVALILLGVLRENIVFFMLPSEFLEKQNLKPGRIIRLGGRVKPGTIHTQGPLLTFTLMDEKASLSVVYKGVVPDLFRDQQGVVVEGTFDSTLSVFKATKLFAKHDETYIPREVVNSLKKQSLPNRFQNMDSKISPERPECTEGYMRTRSDAIFEKQILKGEGYLWRGS